MIKSPRLAALIAVPIALASGFSFAYPSWPESLGLDFWNVPRLLSTLDAEDRFAKELEQHGNSVKARIQFKEAAVDELLAGLIGLREAANQFLEMNRHQPDALANLRLHFRGATDEERCAAQVISYIKSRNCDPRVTEALLGELSQELQRWAPLAGELSVR
jgi:hypothetical protein